MSLMDIVAELLADTQEIRPHSPPIRPAKRPDSKGFSPQSPHSPPRDVKTVKKALGYGCAGCGCREYTQAEIWVTYLLTELSPWKYEDSLVQGWKCDKCGSEFQFIGGSKGPQLIS